MNFSETIFLFFLALIIFGPKKLPEIARWVGKAMNEFRRASNEFKSQIEQEIANIEVQERRKTILPPSPAPEGTASRTPAAASTEPSASATPVNGSGTDSGASAAPATLAASEDEPLFATENPPARATEALPDTESPTASSSQESHA